MEEAAELTEEIVITDEASINARRLNALTITGIALPFLLYTFLCPIFLSADQPYALRFFYSRLIIWAILVIVWLYAYYGEVQRFFLWPAQEYKAGFYIKWIALLYLLGMAAGLIAKVPDWFGLHEDNHVVIKMAAMQQQYPMLLVFAALTAGVTEEYIFRGYILSRMALYIKNANLQVWLSALLFGFAHIGYKSLREFIFATLIGVIYGYHYQKYRNITVLVIVHCIVDLVAFAIFKVHR